MQKSPFSRFELRVVIYFLWAQDKLVSEIIHTINTTLKVDCVHKSAVYKWISSFEDNIFDCDELPRTGRPRNTEAIAKVQQILTEDAYRSAKSIAEEIGIEHETVTNNKKNDIGMKKVNFKWIPHSLTIDQKLQCVAMAKEMLLILRDTRFPSNIIITGDET